MFVTRDSRRVAKLSVLLLAAAFGSLSNACDALAQSSGWTARGTSGSQSSAADSAPAENPWRLPNGQIIPAPSTENSVGANLREPAKLAAPTNAAPIASAQPAHLPARSTNVQKHTPSAAVTQTAATMPSNRPANLTTRQMAQPQFNSPRIARAMPARPGVPTASRSMHRMNIAMNGPDISESEDLPLPGTSPKSKTKRSIDTSDPFSSDPNGYYVDGDGPIFMDGVPGGYGPNGCCECGGACGCGDGCEPGCGCSGSVCGDPCCNDCLSIGPGDPESCHSIRIRTPRWQELSIFAGVQGFKGPYDQNRDAGNFGFHEGFNAGFKIPYTYMGYQLGYQSTQSDLNGDEGVPSDEAHSQHFTTFGVYRRAQDGLQFGSVWDTLVDRRHNTRTFHQIRNELSWMDCGVHEFGAGITIGIVDHVDPNDNLLDWGATDQYVLFYRIHGKNGGEGRVYGGWTNDSDGIIGADVDIPIHDRWSIMSGFTYMIPDAQNGIDGANEEAWNISLALVWHWDCRARKSFSNPYRPLFNVANNGSMVIDNH